MASTIFLANLPQGSGFLRHANKARRVFFSTLSIYYVNTLIYSMSKLICVNMEGHAQAFLFVNYGIPIQVETTLCKRDAKGNDFVAKLLC